MGTIVNESEELGDSAAENALEAIMRFNEDMKLLSGISYLFQDLFEQILQEHDQLVEWMTDLEHLTLDLEETILTEANTITTVHKSVIKNTR